MNFAPEVIDKYRIVQIDNTYSLEKCVDGEWIRVSVSTDKTSMMDAFDAVAQRSAPSVKKVIIQGAPR